METGHKDRAVQPATSRSSLLVCPWAWEVGAGSWLLSGHGSAMTPSHSRSPLPKQQPWPLPGCQILISCGGWSCGHLCAHPMAIGSHRQFSLCLAATSLLIYGLVLADKSQTFNIQFFPRLSERCFPLCHQWQLKAKQRKKKHPGRKKPPSVLEGCVIYSNSLCSFIKPSLTQNMSP